MKPVPPANKSQGGLVSVITPCHNAAPFLAETIESVAAQTYPKVEHIVVDDGSTDGTWDVIARYGQRVTALRLGQNRGGSHARNHGAEVARGEFLMFLDADDVIARDTVEALLAAVGDRPGQIAFCRWKLLRHIGGRWIESPAAVMLPTPGADPLSEWLLGSWVPPCAILWRRTDYEHTGGWDETLTANQDGDLMLRALVRGAGLIGTDRGEAYYRSHSGARLSVSGNIFTADKLRSRMRVFDKLAAELDREGLAGKYAEPLGIAYQRLAGLGFQAEPEIARECLRRGEAYTGRRAVSRTWLGRLLTRFVGLERKEQIAGMLGRLGIMTSARRQVQQLRQLAKSTRGELKGMEPEPNDSRSKGPSTPEGARG
jgi:glycosyltransferase involved in cell wall biosynthesis